MKGLAQVTRSGSDQIWSVKGALAALAKPQSRSVRIEVQRSRDVPGAGSRESHGPGLHHMASRTGLCCCSVVDAVITKEVQDWGDRRIIFTRAGVGWWWAWVCWDPLSPSPKNSCPECVGPMWRVSDCGKTRCPPLPRTRVPLLTASRGGCSPLKLECVSIMTRKNFTQCQMWFNWPPKCVQARDGYLHGGSEAPAPGQQRRF